MQQVWKRYVDFYMNAYLAAHMSNIDFQRVLRLRLDDRKQVCDEVRQASFITSSRYETWLHKLAQLKLADSRVSREWLSGTPTAPDGFNPVNAIGSLPKVDELTDELEEISAGYTTQFCEALTDPAVQSNYEMLTEGERATAKQYIEDKITLTKPYVTQLIAIIQKLQKGFRRVEITHDDLLRLFLRPMTKTQAIAAFTEYINQASSGAGAEDVRVIIK